MDSDNLLKQFDASALKKFEEDRVWNAFLGVIRDRIDLIRNELETGITTIGEGDKKQLHIITYEGLKERQGECAGLRFIINIPETVKQLWTQDKEMAKSKKKKKEE